MSYQAYKVLHLLGVVLVFTGLGGLAYRRLSGAAADGKKLASITHGVGLVVAFVAGFGLLARLGYLQGGLPGWAWLKLLVWLALGALPVLIDRLPAAARLWWALAPLLGAAAAWLAVYKPGG